MRYRGWIVSGVFMLAVVILMGYFKISIDKTPPVMTHQTLIAEATRDLQNAQLGHSIRDVSIIYWEQVQNKRVYVVSYQMDKTPMYGELIGDESGFDSITSKREMSQNISWGAIQLADASGIQMVGGPVLNTAIQKIILTFSNGYIAQVPVHNGYFCFATAAIPRQIFYKSIVGVTGNGDLVLK